jgi:hypothetical protein
MAPHSTISHYINESEIPSDHRTQIEKLRNALGPELLEEAWFFNDDFSLLRWLYGWDFKIAEILPRFKQSACTLIALKIGEHLKACEGDMNTYVTNLTPCAEYFPGGVMSFDKDGNAVFLQCISKVHPRSLVKCDRVSELFKLVLVEAGLTYLMLREKEQKSGKKLGLKIIIDMEGFSKDLLYGPTLKTYLALLKLMQETFPDFARALYVINAPSMMSAVYALVKPVLAKQTQEKITFLPKDYKKLLCDAIGEEYIYEKWGGTLKPPGEKETGTLRMGGMTPDHLMYQAEKNPFHIKDSSLIKLNVPARNKKEVKITVDKPGSKLNWFFVSSNDIEFYIQKDGKDIWPRFRLSTEFVPEWNTLACEDTGEYVLIFDNSYGTIFSKDVKFHAFVN